MNIKTEKTYDIFALDAYLEKPTYNMNEHLEAYLCESIEFYSNVFKDINRYRPKNWPTGSDMEVFNSVELMIKQMLDDIKNAEMELESENE